MKIGFFGAAKTVTGSKHIITTENGHKILLDCGMFQGRGAESDQWNRHLGFDPMQIDMVILSHAHIDHSGLLPFLVNQGYDGPIYSTSATRDLCVIMLQDSARIQESDVEYINKHREREGRKPIKALYTVDDALETVDKFITIPYNKETNLLDDVKLIFTDSGHILGSAAVNLKIKEKNQWRNVMFSGDIGRPGDKILKDPQPFPQAEIIITESTYGDRLHEEIKNSESRLLQIVLETCTIKKGKLIIPAFSLDRTQEIVYALNLMKNSGSLPDIKVYVDSPLSTNATNVMRMHPECFNKVVFESLQYDPDPFGFDGLKYIRKAEDSIALNSLKEPCIIISASGMMEAGRIKHHLKNNISDPRNTLLLVGYCSPESLGGKIMRGEKKVYIFGKEYDMVMDLEIIDAYSAHGDYNEMIQYLSCQNSEKVKTVFLVHGEEDVQKNYSKKLNAVGFKNVVIPEKGEEFEV